MWNTQTWAALLLCVVAASSLPVGGSAGGGGAVTVTVTVFYPEGQLSATNGAAAFLSLRGSAGGLDWKKGRTLERVGENKFSTELELSLSEVGKTVEFKALINDETWQLGSNDAFVATAGAELELYPWFHSSEGSISHVEAVHSPQLNNTRALDVYLPPSYSENPLRPVTSVLLMHDGNNIFDQTCDVCCPFGCWEVQDTLDTLIVQGGMQEVLVVGVYCTQDRMEEYTYSKDKEYGGGRADDYLDFLENQVMSVVQSNYRVPKTLSETTMGILGSSLGGLVSCYAGWTRSNVYSKAGCMSSSFWWNKQDFNTTVLPTSVKTLPPASFYLDSGDQGDGKDDEYETIAVRDHLESLGKREGVNLAYYLDHGGSHSEASWGKRFWRPMQALYPPVSPNNNH